MNTLCWLNTPFWDQRYPGMEVITVVAPLLRELIQSLWSLGGDVRY